MALRTPISRTRDARFENSRASSSWRPNSFTSNAPLTLKRSVICVFIAAFTFIASREITWRRLPTRLAGMMNTGRTKSASNVRRHSSANIAASVVTNTITFETTDPRVPVTALCAPITSLFMRLISAPVCVRVKNEIGSRCTWSNNAARSS